MSQTLHPDAFGGDFVWGTSASAYQYEGASDKYGKGPSIWDTFTHERPGKIGDGSNGTTAVDFYHRYKDDVQIMKDIGFKAFRLSISWSRILPRGKISKRDPKGIQFSEGVNQEGIKFYHDLIDELQSNGITPFVTLFHWDLPQELESDYMGFLDTQIVEDFRDYAEICFSEYGDKVKYWITLNEPVIFCCGGYGDGGLAPGRGRPASSSTPPNSSSTNSPAEGHETFTGILLPRCQATEHAGDGGIRTLEDGDPGREPYIVACNQLLAHAAAVKLYKEKFQDVQKGQKGQIGIVLVSNWFLPFDADSEKDEEAVRRALDFMLGWFMEPLIRGAYPQNMIDYVDKDRLPDCPHEVQGSYDFIGINYYTAQYVRNSPKPSSPEEKPSYKTDPQLETTYYNKNCVPIGEQSGAYWLYIYPKGIGELLKWIAEKYGNDSDLVIYITENGVGEKDDFKKTVKQGLEYKDASGGDMRTNYHHDHLLNLLNAMTDDIMEVNHVEVKGYFVWSLLDNYEWAAGYKTRFGLVYVDYKDGHLARHRKKSAKWFKKFLEDSFPGRPREFSVLA